MWDLKTGRLLPLLGGFSEGVSAISVSPDGSRILGVDSRGEVFEIGVK
jgi:WD40 repeat protein